MTTSNFELPDRARILATFDREAPRYDEHAVLEQEVGSRLMDRLVFQRRAPRRIIDLGSGTGSCCAALKRRYRQAEVIGLDASLKMSQLLQRRSSFFRPLLAVCADLSQLPFADRTADLLFSNLALQWSQGFDRLAEEFRRVLRPDGLLLFSTLGPDSLKEFRLAAGYGPDSSLARHFTDMHDMGDALLSAGFSDTVVDSELVTMEYRQFEALVAELEATGANTHFGDWSSKTGPESPLAGAYQTARYSGSYPVTWEIVYGAAFGPGEGQPIKTPQGDVAAFSVDSLRRSLRRR